MSEVKINIEAKRNPNLLGSFGIPRQGVQPPLPSGGIVVVPDFALQFFSCDIEGIERVPVALRQHYRDNGIDADVRSNCNVANRFAVCVWLSTTLPGSAEDQARNRAMDALDINKPGGAVFNLFVNSSFIRSEADKVFSIWPKVLNEDGLEDSNGPTHLSGLSINFHSPDKITTVISGYDERPWPDANFVFTITDTFNASGGDIQVVSTDELEIDTTILNFLTSLFITRFPPLGLVFLAQSVFVSVKDFPIPHMGGAGAYVTEYLPKEIMIDQGKKVLVSYLEKRDGGVEVSEAGVIVGGYMVAVPREPSLTLGGPQNVTIDEGQQFVDVNHNLITHDIRPSYQNIWSVDDRIVETLTSNNLKIANIIRYNCADVSVGNPRHRRLSVSVTDADGLQVEVRRTVTIIARRPPQQPGEEPRPPICDIRPWLPQCNPEEPE